MLGRSAAAARRLMVVAVLVGIAALVAPATAPASEPPSPRIAHRAGDERDRCGPLIVKPSGRTWECTFVDNFSGTTLDSERWMTQRTTQTGFRTERTCYTDSPDNLALSDGTLVLTARKGRMVNCHFGAALLRTRYTGGMIGVRDRYTQTYGRFEVRGKFPATQDAGVHGGFWMYPRDDTYGRWPSSGEIDVAEWWSSDPTLVIPSLHFDGRDPDVDSGWDCRVEDVSAFHTYTVVWRRKLIEFSIDGVPCFSRSWDPDSPLRQPQPFDHPFRMILNMGVSASTATRHTDFPAPYVVDYVKAWK
ncbi:glycoside hydrolase family 16 protein [Nocardioides humilatus]|uniref:glycoside hydrolase family 16 protein n=1 Tax=Nocardioides humilatus TaxID=2607660 RepID=UPI00165FB18B|nr:glycoside hydrolase family 16 protein [Nocardioides humilatus]